MKRTCYFFLLTFCSIFILAIQKGNAQTKIVGQDYVDSCSHLTIYVSTDSFKITSSPMKIELSFGDGTKDTVIAGTTTAIGTLNIFKHVYTSSGTFTTKSVLITATGSRIDSTTRTFTHIACTYMSGWLYVDKNSNCLLDSGDDTLMTSISIEVDSSGIPIDTILGYGRFIYLAKSFSSTSYDFKVISVIPGLALSCPSTGKLSATSVPGTYVNAGNFGFICSGSSFDIAIHPVTHAGRHSMSTAAILTSTSCTKKSGTFSITVDSKYAIRTSSIYPSGGTVSGNTVTWSYIDINVINSKYFTVSAEVPSTWLTPGTAVSTTFYAPPISGDVDTANNKAIIADTVTSSWDPNDKQVSPKGNIDPSATLTYTLSFENTGNAAAKNIHILDTLSSDLDASSMQIITSSHAVKLYESKLAGSGRTLLNFDFPNINLPDSSHHGLCDGFVNFSIKTKGSLPIGTVVHNSAGIYFDDNDVVLTNTTSNKVAVLSISSPELASDVLIYPNPTGDDFTIRAPKGNYTEFEIINSVGQRMMQQPIQNEETHVNAKSLVPGIYFIMMKGNNGMNVERFEKK